jgi:hypothetical protein
VMEGPCMREDDHSKGWTWKELYAWWWSNRWKTQVRKNCVVGPARKSVKMTAWRGTKK